MLVGEQRGAVSPASSSRLTATIEQSWPIGTDASHGSAEEAISVAAAAAKVQRTGDSRWGQRHLHFKAPPEPTQSNILLFSTTQVGVGVERSEVTILDPRNQLVPAAGGPGHL